MNRTLPKKSIRLCLLSLCFSAATMQAQDLKKPVLGFSDACASEGYNSFSVQFKWDPTPIVESDNQFILELSDANGSFSSPTTLATIADKNTTFDFPINFKMPKTVRGENYKVRVRSTNPAKTGKESNPFGAYYLNVAEPLVVNNFEEASVCEATTVFLEVDNYPNEESYNWYKDMALIPGENGPSIEVSEPGIYFAEIDYGSYCSTSTASNLVEVYIENSVGVELIGAKQVSLCESQTYTLTTDFVDPTVIYAWYKDGELLTKNNSNTLEVKGSDPGFAGDYYVQIERPGGCNEKTSTVSIQAGGFDVAINTPNGTLVLPQQSIAIEVTTNAEGASYAWYRNGTELAGETNSVLQVNVPGEYAAKVTQIEGCQASRTTESITVTEPSEYIASINASNYSACESASATLALDKIETEDSNGNPYELPESMMATASYQWVYNQKPLTGETNRTISVSKASLNGKYALQVSLEGGKQITSNTFEVKLGISENPQISGNGSVTCDNGNSIEIVSTVKKPEYTYTWYRNGVALTDKGTSFTTNLSGKYQLKIEAYGCSAMSNEFIIEEFNPSVVSLNVSEMVTIPEGDSKVVTASGADSYQWFNTKNELMSSDATVTLSEEGEYMLLASVGDCQVTKKVQVTHAVSFVVPNIVTPNGDGYNDLWVIPKSYAYQKDITVNIYEQSGATVFTATGYQNNWPESSSITHTGGRPPIYYYQITKGKETLKQGTITVIK
ncbi:T9SS type B sorting domain-containing protein [Galbibacter mesophilus]|uniref:T9SS type B sorting domain-containing protein n=1 Tax=Galbibacter mesophilus TaxID=379069 RepID=UPI00191F131B|nr:gliding motility-associated C-terminal domain-containing protein [Galbibacter mesophilus]MCM5662286.1 gliding motility-associated C-terminal domain-containing protein [Galbibacter mesophilus]